jgi:hypothetical protein
VAILGAWALSATVAMLITLVLIPLNNRLTFRGDAGVVIMWVWSGLPEAVTAVGATLAVLWLIDTKRLYAWIGALAALYLYDGVIDAVQTRGGFQSAPTVLDNIGIISNGLMPAVACAIAAVWYQRQRSASVTRV